MGQQQDKPAGDDNGGRGVEQPREKFELKAESAAPQARLPLKSPAAADGGEARPARRRRDTARLVWDSKPKRPPSPRDIEFQTAEVVIPNPARDADALPFTFRDGVFGNDQPDRAKMNRLIWGDNLLAMQALLAQGYEGKVDLIYIDPPFDSKADYSYELTVGDLEVTKEPSVIERLAYRDTWDGGTDSYLDMLYPRLQLMRRLLSDRGVIFIHIGPDVAPYVRIVTDEVFGKSRLLNEIIWKRTPFAGSSKSLARKFPVNHDLLFMYSKSDDYQFEHQYVPYSDDYIARFKNPDNDPRTCYALFGLISRLS